jgi:hypothetical protein
MGLHLNAIGAIRFGHTVHIHAQLCIDTRARLVRPPTHITISGRAALQHIGSSL